MSFEFMRNIVNSSCLELRGFYLEDCWGKDVDYVGSPAVGLARLNVRAAGAASGRAKSTEAPGIPKCEVGIGRV